MKKIRWLKWCSLAFVIAAVWAVVLLFVLRIDYDEKIAATRAEYAALLESIQADGEDARPRLVQLRDRHPELFTLDYDDYWVNINAIRMLRSGHWDAALLQPAKDVLADYQDVFDELLRVLRECNSFTNEYDPDSELLILDQSLYSTDHNVLLRNASQFLLISLRSQVALQDWEMAKETSAAYLSLARLQMQIPTIMAVILTEAHATGFALEIRLLCREQQLPASIRQHFRKILLGMIELLLAPPDDIYLGEKLTTQEAIYITHRDIESRRTFPVPFFITHQLESKLDTRMNQSLAFWEDPRSNLLVIPEDEFDATAASSANMLLSSLPQIRAGLEFQMHQVVSAIAVIDIEGVYAETGRYPDVLPEGIVELIPEVMRFGEGIVYEVVDGGQDYVLRLPVETPERWIEAYDGVYSLEREPLSDSDIEWLEWMAEGNIGEVKRMEEWEE